MPGFDDFRLCSPILDPLTTEGYITPTPIQSQAIPHAMARRDLCGIAQKALATAAFALPVLHRLAAQPKFRWLVIERSQRGPDQGGIDLQAVEWGSCTRQPLRVCTPEPSNACRDSPTWTLPHDRRPSGRSIIKAKQRNSAR